MKRIVIKIGSNILTRTDGFLDVTRISSFVDQIAQIRKDGVEVVLVSSGAVACGRSIVRERVKLDAVEQRQLYSAVGQVRLMSLYSELFGHYGMNVGQILTMKDSFATRREYLNQRCCMEVMLKNGIVPIVNENDTVSVTELMFTDNDELSGLVASMLEADMLIILSNIDGVYDGDPKNESSHVIEHIMPGEDLSAYISPEKSSLGRGGMISKCGTALKVAGDGIAVVIANGKRPNILLDIVKGKDVLCTRFMPDDSPVSGVRKWIANSGGFAKGSAVVDDRAASILTGEFAASLLMVGVQEIEGEFEEGDIICIKNRAGQEIALGRSSYDSSLARDMLGMHDVKPLIHHNYLYLI